jgi:hypothetical protein
MATVVWGLFASGLWPLLTLVLFIAAPVAIVPWIGPRLLGLVRWRAVPVLGTLTGIAAAGSIFAMSIGVTVLGATLAPLPSPSPTSASATTPPSETTAPKGTATGTSMALTQSPAAVPTLASAPPATAVPQTAAPVTSAPTVAPPTAAPTTAPRTAVPTAAPLTAAPTAAPRTAAPRTAAPTTRTNCHPSYPTVCIPPAPPDLDCGDIPHRFFTVLPPDPHKFDGNDNDGIGCES